MATPETPPPASSPPAGYGPGPVPGAPPPPPPPRRSSARWGWVAVPVAVLAAIPAGAWLIGGRIESGYAQRMARATHDFPVLAKAKVSYQRGLFGATRTTTFDLNAAYGNCLPADKGAPRQPMVLTAVEHIQHGPFPGGRGFGAARVTYDFRVNGQPLSSFFNRPLGGATGPVMKLTGALPEMVTTYGFGGGSTVDFKGPAATLVITQPHPAAPAAEGEPTPPSGPESVTLAWKSLDGSFDLNGAGDKIKGALDFDGFNAGMALGHLTAGKLSYRVNQVRDATAGWWLGSGTGAFKLDRLDVRSGPLGATEPADALFSAADVTVDSQQTVEAGTFGGAAKMAVKSLTLLGETLGPVNYDLSFSRLDAGAWKAFVDKSYGPLLNGCPAPLAAKDPQEELAEMMTSVKALLAKSPEVRLDRLSLAWGGKQIALKGAVRLTGVEASDLRAPDPSGLLQKVSAEGEARMDDGFVNVVAAAAAKRSVLGQHKASAAGGAIPPELFQRMGDAQTEAEQQAVMAEITAAQAKATANLTDAKMLADPAVQTEIKTVTAENVAKATQLRDKFLAAGLLVREGAQLAIKGTFKNGQALVNGKPLASYKAALGEGENDGEGPDAAPGAEAEAE